MSGQLLSFFINNSDLRLDDAAATDQPKLLWKVVLRTGTWKLRPGPGGVKMNAPLTIYRDKAPKGHISMADLVKNFDAAAKENVTTVGVHADGTLADNGFVRKLIIQDVPGENGSKDKQSLLWAGLDITEPDVKAKIENKTLVGVSGGILFDYQRTEDAKKFNQILSHVMITNSPWINGTGGFTDKLPSGVMASEPDDLPVGELEPDDEIVPVSLDAPGVTAPDDTADPNKTTPPPAGTVVWKPEEGYQFARGKVQKSLDEWRRSMLGNRQLGVTYEDFPCYHVEDVAPGGSQAGKALICSGYGNDKEAWVALYNFDDDGDAEIEPFMNWTSAKQEWIAASEEVPAKPAPSAGRPPTPIAPSRTGDALRMAQQRRAEIVGLGRPSNPTGGIMGSISDLLAGVELSEEQRAAIAEEERKREEADRKLVGFAQDARKTETETYLAKLKGAGLDAPGLLAYVSNVFMSDDGEPALALSEETETGQRTQPRNVTASEIIKGMIDALPKDDKGKVTLSTQARRLPDDPPPPADNEEKPVDAAKAADEMAADLAEFGLDIPLSTANSNGA